MGGELSRYRSVNRIKWWLVEVVSRLLTLDEREAVRGDFTESGETGGQALLGLVGLVVRRQAALWTDWRPWLVLVALVAPFGMLLSLVSRNMAGGTALPIWMYLDNWTWIYVTSPGARIDLARYGGEILFQYAMLFCWSWTCGLLLRSLSHKTISLNGALFCLVLLFGERFRVPRSLGHWLLLPARGGNHAVFASTFYRVVFPAILLAVLVVIPSLWGMRHGIRLTKLPALQRGIFFVCGTAAVVALASQNWIWWQVRTWDVRPAPYPHLPSLLPVALLGPVGYKLAITRSFIANRKETKI
jgi:hypothetical protein